MAKGSTHCVAQTADGLSRSVGVGNFFCCVSLFELDGDELINIDYLYEPSKKKIVKSLIPRYLNAQVWKYLLESYASEQAARMIAMENATSNSEDMIKSLTLEFNKARQAAITTEMLEIVSGAEALKE